MPALHECGKAGLISGSLLQLCIRAVALTSRLHDFNTALSKPKIDTFDVDAAVHTCGQAALVSGGSSDPFQMNSPWQQYSAYGI
jgi:hypothetical protein